MIPPTILSARDRLRSEGYRISDAAEFTEQNAKGGITRLSISFTVTGPGHKRQTGNGVADFQTLAHMVRSTGEAGTHAGHMGLCRDEPAGRYPNRGRIRRKLSARRWPIEGW